MPGMRLENDHLSLLCDPDTRYAFEQDGSTLRNIATGRVYPVRDGIPLFISSLTGNNLRSQVRSDRIASLYDLGTRLHRLLNQSRDARGEFLAPLRLPSGARVLEVGIGTGANLPGISEDAELHGVDISWRMLSQCRKKLHRMDREASLYQAEACRLPFRAAIFDAVIQTLGMRGFSSPQRAIREMIWVTRPGGQVVLVEAVPSNDGKGTDGADSAPVSLREWIPAEMDDVQAELIGEGQFERVSFRVPLDLPHPAEG